ncbi:MAG TPA: hydroxymethylbilane synthase [Thermoleophilia bacterium]|nr:hydroxymethylbilane synthase [Thermoleophilia bacterium]
MSRVLRIGSRGSRLALTQSEWVRDRLQDLHPDLTVAIEVIHTKGDKVLDAPLAKIGDKGLFTKELEAALFGERVDLAVHSAKDMPTETPEGLAIVAFTAREDVHDVFVARGADGVDVGSGAAGEADAAPPSAAPPSAASVFNAARDDAFPRSLADLPDGAVVGTSSLRRRAQLLAARPDLTLVDIRGNVETRLRKVAEQRMAGTVLAAAGLARLGRAGVAAFAFPFDEMLPAVGQGSLAIEARVDDEEVRALVAPLVDAPTTAAVRAERALMRALEGGCQVPIGALGELESNVDGDGTRGFAGLAGVGGPAGVVCATGLAGPGDPGRVAAGPMLRLRAFVGSLDGSDVVRLERRGGAGAPEALGRALAADLLAAGADRILRSLRAEAGDG